VDIKAPFAMLNCIRSGSMQQAHQLIITSRCVKCLIRNRRCYSSRIIELLIYILFQFLHSSDVQVVLEQSEAMSVLPHLLVGYISNIVRGRLTSQKSS